AMTIAPLVYKNIVIVGTSGAEYGVRGFLQAFDATTSAAIWRFYVIPDKGWEGKWATTTPEGDPLHRDIAAEKAAFAKYKDAWKRGGGSTWVTPAADPDLNLIYFGVGNPSPDLDGAVRPGDNLYTESIVAVNAANGQLAWYYQEVPHDVWDLDQTSPPLLFNANVELWLGSAITGCAGGKQYGTFTAIDVTTGKVAWQKKGDQPMMGGSRATAGGLGCSEEGNGAFDAFDAKTGELLWQFQAGAGVNAAPMAFELDGQEYVAVAAGGNFQLSYPYGDALIVFGLPKR